MADATTPTSDRRLTATLTGAPAPTSDDELDEALSRPPSAAIEAFAGLDGDLVILGAGGKMGLSLARMAARAWEAAGVSGRRVIAVSRFGAGDGRDPFERHGIGTISADLLDPAALTALPDAPNVLYLAGMKFGSTGDQPSTWAMNAFLPGLVARRYPSSRIVALSTANVYPFMAPASGGAREDHAVGPVGEYAQSCLGRERVFEWHSRRNGTPVTLIRLAYANALTYGVLVDIAQRVLAREPVDLAMGYANVIWQGDANAAILGAFSMASSPASFLNLSGPEVMSVRETTGRFAELLGVASPSFRGQEAETALLIDSSVAHARFGAQQVALPQLTEWTAAWLRGKGRLLGKPTHFEARDGKF
jgi:nucleoside-diphosphate-sugar epimerase